MIKDTDTGLTESNIQKIRGVFQNHPEIEKAVLYGSRVLGTYKNGSDIDLTLQTPQLSLTDLLQIENEIDDLLLPYKVDLSLFHQIENRDLIGHINQVGKVFYERNPSLLKADLE